MKRASRFLHLALLLAGFASAADAQQPTPKEPLPALTDEDRKAAFPDLAGHTVHDRKVNYFVLFDQLEWQRNRHGAGGKWDNLGWIGGDVHRLWFRTEGENEDGRLDEAQAHVLYGRSLSRWWDVVAGVRQDFRPGPAQTSAAFGIQGLAPYFFEVEATGYVASDGRFHARFEAEYEMLLTNRLILQPLGEINLSARSDASRGIGSGLGTAGAGFRLRYEIRREFAPYIGIAWNRKLGNTAEFARAADDEISSTRFVAGMRIWF